MPGKLDKAALKATFEAFDQVANATTFPDDAVYSDENYDWKDKIFNALAPMIDALPQKAQIPDDVADKWLRQTFAMELRDAVRERTLFLDKMGYTPEQKRDAMTPTDADLRRAFVQVSWHIRRTTSIGGSEIGDGIANKKGKPAEGFSSATNIVRSKLLMDSPIGGLDQLKRGHREEDQIIAAYCKQFGAVIDKASMEAVRGARVSNYPFITGNPDAIVIRGFMQPDGTTKRKRLIIDSKNPSVDVIKEYLDPSKGVPFNYKAQQHLYGMLLHEKNISFSGYELAPKNQGTGLVESLPFPHSRETIRDIVETAEWLWECVMEGQVPEPIRAEEIELDENTQMLFDSIAYELQASKALEGIAKGRVENLRSQMADMTSGTFGRIPVTKGFGEFKSTAKYDEDMLLSIAATVVDFDVRVYSKPGSGIEPAGVERLLDNIEMCRNMEEVHALIEDARAARSYYKEGWDLAGIAAALTERGVDVSPARKEVYSYAETRKKKGPEVEIKQRFAAEVDNMTTEMMEMLTEKEMMDSILDGKDPETNPEDEYQP